MAPKKYVHQRVPSDCCLSTPNKSLVSSDARMTGQMIQEKNPPTSQ